MLRTCTILATGALVMATPAHASDMVISAPAGPAGDVALVIARQMGISIVIADPAVASRRVPAMRGKLSPRQAVERLARAADARVIAAGESGWRLVAAPARRPPAIAPRARPHPAPAPFVLPPPEKAPDIIVTASKRDTRLADYAGEPAMIDGATLQFGGVSGTDRIVQNVAAVTSTHLGSGRNKLFIRGIADSSFTGPTQSTVGMYLGDLRINYNAPDPDLRLSDMGSVEVLEGPQGTLYGAGSIGGIIRLVPNAPDLGSVAGSGQIGGSLTQHGAPGGDISLMANLPVKRDRAALRVVLDAESQGGYIDRPLVDRDDVNHTDIAGGRATLRVDLGGDWTVDLIGVGQRTRGDDSQYADRSGPPLSRSSVVAEGFSADYGQGQLVVSGKLGAVHLRSSTGIVGQKVTERYDATRLDGPPRLFVQSNHSRMIANETRLWQPLGDRFGWLVGASFTHNRTQLDRTIGPPDAQMPTVGVENIVDEFTGYGEASLRIYPGLIATAGGRWTHSTLGGAGQGVPRDLALARAEITARRTESIFLPSASLLAQVLPETALYLRYQQGFRPGGLAVSGDFVQRYRNDRIGTVEFGVRHGQQGSGPGDVSASISFTDWRDIQADFIDASGLPTTANVGDGHIWTGTLSGGLRVDPHLRIDAALVYNQSRVTEPSFAMLPMLVRLDEVPNIARVGGRVGFDYARPVGNGLTLTAQGWARYVGRSRLGVGPELGARQGDYFDSGLTARIGSASFGVSASVTNIADTVGNRFALGTPFALGRDQLTPLRPRTLRIGLDASF